MNSKTKLAALGLLTAAFIVLGVSLYIKESKENFVVYTQLKIAEQSQILIAIAEITDRDGADAVVEKIIQDCSFENRSRFDELLSNLAQLRGVDLVEVEQLFNACGNYYAERKAVMVSRLNREFEIYKNYIELLEIIQGRPTDDRYYVSEWSQLTDLELSRSSHTSKLVSLQGDIIRALLAGDSVNSEEMQQKLVEAQKTKDSLIKINSQIDPLRQAIINI